MASSAKINYHIANENNGDIITVIIDGRTEVFVCEHGKGIVDQIAFLRLLQQKLFNKKEDENEHN